MSCPNRIISHRNQGNPTRHQTTEIHRLSHDRCRHRPKAKEEDDNPKKDRKHIDSDAENARDMERSPNELIDLSRVVVFVDAEADGSR